MPDVGIFELRLEKVQADIVMNILTEKSCEFLISLRTWVGYSKAQHLSKVKMTEPQYTDPTLYPVSFQRQGMGGTLSFP